MASEPAGGSLKLEHCRHDFFSPCHYLAKNLISSALFAPKKLMAIDNAPMLSSNGLPMPSSDVEILKNGVPDAPADLDVGGPRPLTDRALTRAHLAL
jgi:hypothetical protein